MVLIYADGDCVKLGGFQGLGASNKAVTVVKGELEFG